MAALLTCEKNNMTAFFHFLLALAVILAPASACQLRQTKIRIRYILQLIIIEIALAFFFLHAESGLWLVKIFPAFFASLLGFAAEGTNFVFGGMSEKGLAFIFLGRPVSDCVYFRADWYSPALADPADFYSRDWHPAVESKRHG